MSHTTRVLHVIPSIGAARGGPSVVIRTMARSQAIAGMEVDVATTDDDGPGRISFSRRVPIVEEDVTYWIFRRQTRFYAFSFPLTRWLSKHVADYDVVHIHALFSYASTAAAICARLAGVPYIVRPLGVLNEWGMHNRRPWLKRLSFQIIESWILKGAAAVQYTCEQEALEGKRLGVSHRAIVVPNPVELPAAIDKPDAFSRLYPELTGRTVVLFLSRLDPKKGLDLLLPAFARVRKRCPEAILVVAGDGKPSFVAGLKELSHRLGLDSGIVWAGFLRGEEKLAALSGSHLFVLSSYSENFGVAVVEAMGAGLPVIISDQVGIHREIVDIQAGLVVACSVDQIESALLTMLRDAPLRAKMGANGIVLARQFSPERVAQQLGIAYGRIRTNSNTPAVA